MTPVLQSTGWRHQNRAGAVFESYCQPLDEKFTLQRSDLFLYSSHGFPFIPISRSLETILDAFGENLRAKHLLAYVRFRHQFDSDARRPPSPTSTTCNVSVWNIPDRNDFTHLASCAIDTRTHPLYADSRAPNAVSVLTDKPEKSPSAGLDKKNDNDDRRSLVGKSVWAHDGNRWFVAVVQTVHKDMIFIRYVGYAADWDEWVSWYSDRVQPHENGAPAPDYRPCRYSTYPNPFGGDATRLAQELGGDATRWAQELGRATEKPLMFLYRCLCDANRDTALELCDDDWVLLCAVLFDMPLARIPDGSWQAVFDAYGGDAQPLKHNHTADPDAKVSATAKTMPAQASLSRGPSDLDSWDAAALAAACEVEDRVTPDPVLYVHHRGLLGPPKWTLPVMLWTLWAQRPLVLHLLCTVLGPPSRTARGNSLINGGRTVDNVWSCIPTAFQLGTGKLHADALAESGNKGKEEDDPFVRAWFTLLTMSLGLPREFVTGCDSPERCASSPLISKCVPCSVMRAAWHKTRSAFATTVSHIIPDVLATVVFKYLSPASALDLSQNHPTTANHHRIGTVVRL